MPTANAASTPGVTTGHAAGVDGATSDPYRSKARRMDIGGKPQQPTGKANVAGGISAWLGRSNFSRRGGGPSAAWGTTSPLRS